MAWANTYKHGLPVSESLKTTILEQSKRVTIRKASLIIIDGGVGEGKTTLAVHAADIIEGKPINLKEQIGMGGTDFVRKLSDARKKGYKVIIYDEAGDFDKKGAISRFNKMINRIFDTYRGFQIIVILVLPYFNVLDSSIFYKKIPRVLINCHDRTEKYGNYRVYSLYLMYMLKYHISKLKVPPQAYQRVMPNLRGHFLDLPSDRSKELDIISTRAKDDVLSEYNVISDGLFGFKEIASQLNMSEKWVRAKISELKIKHEKVYKLKKYFNESILEQLEGEIGGSRE